MLAATANAPFRSVVRPPAIERVVAGFLEEFAGGEEGLFPSTIVRELAAVESDAQAAAFYALLAALRDAFNEAVGEDAAAVVRAETLLQQGHVAVGEYVHRLIAALGFRRDIMNRNLRSISRQLLSRFDMREFLQALADGLPLLGIPACCFSLYDAPTGLHATARLVLASAGRNVLELGFGRPWTSRWRTTAPA